MKLIMEQQYNPKKIEKSASDFWEKNQSFKAVENKDLEKFYCLSMFPYPSGKLHIGHVRNYTIGDVISRYQRMLGKNVLQPMGWDAFGLPAENAAIKNKTQPAKWTRSNISYMKNQLKSLGFGYDWDREISTCDSSYYRWEQWLFTKLLEKGLAYRKTASVNWDPIDKTVLANEQVIDGKGWRSGAKVEKKNIEQWFLKITDYAEELLEDLGKLTEWPDQVVAMQRNWIGRSEGVYMFFDIEGSDEKIEIFTTRPDTLMGVTYLAVAAEHPLSKEAAKTNKDVANFIQNHGSGNASEAEIEMAEKKGCALGLNAIHPVTNKKVPIYSANFVLMTYGSGAVMAVPAHDQRDWEFAEKYSLPKKQVVFQSDGQPFSIEKKAFTEKGVLADSAPFDGLSSEAAFDAIASWLQKHEKGGKRVNYRLRDWGISRQRYWGCPIPIIKRPDGSLKIEEDLPIKLPENVHVDGSGSPLGKMPEFFDLGPKGTRETDTFDTFVESSWYYARYCCPDLQTAMLDDRAKYWLPVDQYVGGIEHAILHLLYARFFNKLMRDEGLIDNDEPFTRLLTQGMVIAETFYRNNLDGTKEWYNPADVIIERNSKGEVISSKLKVDQKEVISGGFEKMSKSKNNGIDPQSLIDKYGADTVRLYTIFTAPPDQSLEWSDEGVEGAYRFLKRLWNLAYKIQHNSIGENSDENLKSKRQEIHQQLKKALFDYERQHFNTVVSSAMSIVNILNKVGSSKDGQSLLIEGISIVLRLLAPITPHITHQLWQDLKFGENIQYSGWPQVDESALVQKSYKFILQVNGKVRSEIEIPVEATKSEIEEYAKNDRNINRFIEGKMIKKIIIVPGKLVNIVAS